MTIRGAGVIHGAATRLPNPKRTIQVGVHGIAGIVQVVGIALVHYTHRVALVKIIVGLQAHIRMPVFIEVITFVIKIIHRIGIGILAVRPGVAKGARTAHPNITRKRKLRRFIIHIGRQGSFSLGAAANRIAL